MSDLLRFDHINSLPHPLYARVSGDWWPVYDIEVLTGLVRIDVCGLLQVSHIAECGAFRDSDWVEHDPDTFYVEPEQREPSL